MPSTIPSTSPTIRILHDEPGTPFAIAVTQAEACDEALQTPSGAERTRGGPIHHCLSGIFATTAPAATDGRKSNQIYVRRGSTPVWRVRNGVRLRSKEANAGTTPVVRGGWWPRLRWLGRRTPLPVTSPGATP